MRTRARGTNLAKFDAAGNHLFSKSWGSPDDEHVKTVAIGASGAIHMAGPVQGSLDFGGGALAAAGGTDAFLVRLDADGNHLWSHRFGSVGHDIAHDLALGPSGHVFITGGFSETVEFGGGWAGGADVTEPGWRRRVHWGRRRRVGLRNADGHRRLPE